MRCVGFERLNAPFIRRLAFREIIYMLYAAFEPGISLGGTFKLDDLALLSDDEGSILVYSSVLVLPVEVVKMARHGVLSPCHER